MTFDQRVQLFEDLEKQEEQKKKVRAARMLRAQDHELQVQYDLEHQNGYCPKCHCLRALNGSCSCD